MNKVAIVTDSTANLPESYIKENHITVAPQVVIWDEKTYLDGIDINPEQFYQRLAISKSMPSSSQVSPQDFKKIYTDLHAQGFDILTIVISSKLSGTMNSVTQAIQMTTEANVAVVDSFGASMSLGFPVLQAARAAQNGASLQECKAVAERACMQSNVYFVVDTLDFLHRGGRLGAASHFVGTALNLKPILTLHEGKIEAIGKVRTQKKAIEKMLDIISGQLQHARLVRLSVLHANVPEQAAELLAECNRRFNPSESILSEISPVIGTHTGPGTLGVAFLRDM